MEEHINAHNSYQEKMDEFIAEAESKKTDTKKIAFKIAEFAGSWLMNHIMIMDQKYIPFMQQNSIN
jgi:hemerythrin